MQVSEISDSQLIESILSGDDKLFDALMDRYEETVYQIACDLCGREDEAAQVVEDVFVKIYRDLENLKDETFLESLHRFTYDTALSKLVMRIEGHAVDAEAITREMLPNFIPANETEIIEQEKSIEEIDFELEEAKEKLDSAKDLINCITRFISDNDSDSENEH